MNGKEREKREDDDGEDENGELRWYGPCFKAGGVVIEVAKSRRQFLDPTAPAILPFGLHGHDWHTHGRAHDQFCERVLPRVNDRAQQLFLGPLSLRLQVTRGPRARGLLSVR